MLNDTSEGNLMSLMVLKKGMRTTFPVEPKKKLQMF